MYSYAKITGHVMSYWSDPLCLFRPLHPALAYVKFYVYGTLYSPFDGSDIAVLGKQYPSLIEAYRRNMAAFEPVEVNNCGRFEIRGVPVGFWGYVVFARVVDKDYSFLGHPIGNNGFGRNCEISGAVLAASGSNPMEIIIPVPELWMPRPEVIMSPDSNVPPTEEEAMEMVRKKEGYF